MLLLSMSFCFAVEKITICWIGLSTFPYNPGLASNEMTKQDLVISSIRVHLHSGNYQKHYVYETKNFIALFERTFKTVIQVLL